MKLAELAQKLSCRLEGPPELDISGVAGMEHAEPGQLTFLANRKYVALLKSTRASAILLEEGVAIERDRTQPPIAALRSANPYLAFAHALELFYDAPRYASGIHATAIIAGAAKIGEGAHIGPYCCIDEEVEIGRNAVLHSFVTIYRGAKIGDDFVAHAHSVVREHCRIGNRVILPNGGMAPGTKWRSPGRRCWRTMWKCSLTPAWIAPRSARRASGVAPRSMIWCSLAMLQALARILCFAGRSALPGQRK